MRRLITISLSLIIGGCAIHDSTLLTEDAREQRRDHLEGALKAPLHDLNIKKPKIPKVLRLAQKQPYALPEDQSCATLADAVKALDEVLGADLDSPATDTNPGLIVRGVNAIEKESISAIKKTTEGLVPFRNWVRKLSGAERSSRAVVSAISAGTIRRAYLKGIGSAQACKAPAAPYGKLATR